MGMVYRLVNQNMARYETPNGLKWLGIDVCDS
jgi:hypothetical protein